MKRSNLSSPSNLKLSSFVKNEQGMTLVEVMIAGALVIVIALVISQLMVYSNRQQSRTEARSAVSELQQQITQQLRASPVPAP